MTAKIICQREKMIDDTFEEIEDASNPLKDKLPMIIEYFFTIKIGAQLIS